MTTPSERATLLLLLLLRPVVFTFTPHNPAKMADTALLACLTSHKNDTDIVALVNESESSTKSHTSAHYEQCLKSSSPTSSPESPRKTPTDDLT
jgi:hypothetical protein